MKKLVGILLMLVYMGLIFPAFIEGNIVDTDGNPVPDAEVRIYDLDNLFIANGTSDVNGDYRIEDVEGYVKIRIVKEGYPLYRATEYVSSSGLSSYNVMLIKNAIINYDFSSLPNSENGFLMVRQGTTATYIGLGASGRLEVSPGTYTFKYVIPTKATYDIKVSNSLSPGDEITLGPTNATPSSAPFTLNALELNLDQSSVNAGDEVKVKVIAHWSASDYDGDITNAVNWDIDGAGELYLPKLIALHAGEHDISVSLLGVSETETLEVNPGDPVSLELSANPLVADTGDSITLVSTLKDVYGNEWTTNDVTYSTDCGSISGSSITSNSECTAHVDAVYNPDNSLTGSINVRFEEDNSGGSSNSGGNSGGSSNSGSSSGGSYHSNSGSGSSSSNHNTSPKPVVNNTAPKEENKKLGRVVFPDEIIVGQSFTLLVVDADNDAVSGAVVVLKRPDNKTVSLVTDSKGSVKYVTYIPGGYEVSVKGFELKGDTVFTVLDIKKPEPKNVITPKPKRKSTNNTIIIDDNREEKKRSMFDTLVAAFKGEISLADAIRATMPLWIMLGGIMLLAALFFVVYSYAVGRQLHREEESTLASGEVKVNMPPGVNNRSPFGFASEPVAPPVNEASEDLSDKTLSERILENHKLASEVQPESVKKDAVVERTEVLPVNENLSSSPVDKDDSKPSVTSVDSGSERSLRGDELQSSDEEDDLSAWMKKLKRKRSN